MKKHVIALVVSGLLAGNSFASGIPTVDLLQHAQKEMHHVEDIAKAMEQIEQMKTQVQNQITQIEEAKKRYAAITGNRNLGEILNDPALRNYLPEDWKSVYDMSKSGKFDSETIRKVEKLVGKNSGQQRVYDTMIANKAMGEESFKATLKRLDNIKSLMSKANQTQDAKAAADLANRIAAENAMIQNEQTRLNLVMQLQQVEMQLAKKESDKSFASKMFRKAN